MTKIFLGKILLRLGPKLTEIFWSEKFFPDLGREKSGPPGQPWAHAGKRQSWKRQTWKWQSLERQSWKRQTFKRQSWRYTHTPCDPLTMFPPLPDREIWQSTKKTGPGFGPRAHGRLVRIYIISAKRNPSILRGFPAVNASIEGSLASDWKCARQAEVGT